LSVNLYLHLGIASTQEITLEINEQRTIDEIRILSIRFQLHMWAGGRVIDLKMVTAEGIEP
jgi:hypothetical protein